MDEWKLIVGLAILTFGLGFVVIFFLGGQLDYTVTIPGQNATSWQEYLPKWMFPPPR